MNRKLFFAALTLLGGMYASTASAEFVIGAKLGAVQIDTSGAADYDYGVQGSVQLGYEFLNLGLADIALEGELTTSITDAEDSNGLIGDTSFDSTGLYASIRTAGPIYVIGRLGYVNGEISTPTGSVDDSSVSKGIGIGFSGGLRFEIEYTTYEVENVDVEFISLGLSF